MRTLALCVCVLIFATFSVANVQREELKTAILSIYNDFVSCAIEHGLTDNENSSFPLYTEPEIIANVQTQPGNEERIRKNGCLMACMLKKQQLMEGSDIKEDKIYEKIGETYPQENLNMNKVRKMFHKCIEEVKDTKDECEKVFGLYVCISRSIYHETNHDEHIIPEGEEEEHQN